MHISIFRHLAMLALVSQKAQYFMQEGTGFMILLVTAVKFATCHAFRCKLRATAWPQCLLPPCACRKVHYGWLGQGILQVCQGLLPGCKKPFGICWGWGSYKSSSMCHTYQAIRKGRFLFASGPEAS